MHYTRVTLELNCQLLDGTILTCKPEQMQNWLRACRVLYVASILGTL